MKLSELIDRLKLMQDRYGDNTVLVRSGYRTHSDLYVGVTIDDDGNSATEILYLN